MKRIIGITALVITLGSCGAEVTETSGNIENTDLKEAVVEAKQAVIVDDVMPKVIDEIEDEPKAEIVERSVKNKIDPSVTNIEVFDKVSGVSVVYNEVVIAEEVEVVVVEEGMEFVPVVITFNHLKFNELLQKNVSIDGIVNYDSFKKEEHKLNEYLKMLTSTKPVESWSRNKKLVYYINLYNASTISLILKNYPLKSIMDIDKAWDIPFIKVGEKMLSLNDVENKIIRPTFKEPRIHFAVNCAAVSCPKLSNKAFSEKNINYLLQVNTERFLKDTVIGLKQNGSEVELSQIFEWYAVDFGGKEELLNWITANSNLDLSKASFKGFITYNWGLNNK
jgi:hypothetical protein